MSNVQLLWKVVWCSCKKLNTELPLLVILLWGIYPKELKAETQIFAQPWSWQHYSHQPKGGNNPNFHRWAIITGVNGLNVCVPPETVLKHYPQCNGTKRWDIWVVIRITWGHEGGALMNEISECFVSGTPKGSLEKTNSLFALRPHEDIVRRWWPMNWGAGSHQTLNLLVPWPWTLQSLFCYLVTKSGLPW